MDTSIETDVKLPDTQLEELRKVFSIFDQDGSGEVLLKKLLSFLI